MTIDQVMAGAAAITSVNGNFTASVPGAGQTFTVLNASGYPSSGRFTVQLNRGLPDEEKVLISSRSSTTFTVESRGYDGTTPQSHTNPACNLIVPATVINALIEHADDDEVDPHAGKLLNNTRHDTTSRHALGVSIPVSATTPVTITPDHAGTVGTANAVARSDHAHPVNAATASTITGANSEGSAQTFARSDHNHALGTGVVGADALGTGAVAALSDITTAVLEQIFPIGGVLAYGGTAAPTGWLLCDGSAVSRTTYAALFTAISTAYGAGNGSTTFNVPDLRGRFGLGKAASGTGAVLGETGGSIDHVHGLDTSTSHAKAAPTTTSPELRTRRKTVASWTETHTIDGGTTASGTGSHTIGIELGGDSDVANPPYQTFNYIIRAGV